MSSQTGLERGSKEISRREVLTAGGVLEWTPVCRLCPARSVIVDHDRPLSAATPMSSRFSAVCYGPYPVCVAPSVRHPIRVSTCLC